MLTIRRISLRLELLEDRWVPALDPTGLEQEMLEHVNRMRLNPAAELSLLVDKLSPIHSQDPIINSAVNFFEVNGTVLQSQWSKLTPVPALAWNEKLMTAALGHNQMMIQHDEQSHQLPGEPDLGVRVSKAGYNFNSVRESIFAFGESVFSAHAAFAIDWGFTPTGIQDPPGHRDNIMSSDTREVGISILSENDGKTSVGPLVVTKNFGNRFNFGNPFLLGVAYQDQNKNGRYDSQEGLSGVTITIDGVNDFQTKTMTAGGYQIQVPAGKYTVTFSGGALSQPIVKAVTVGSTNVKVDAVASNGQGPSNTAPVLNTAPNPSLPSILEDTANPAGATITSLIGSATSDTDVGALKGAAIVGLNGTEFGTWEFSLNQGKTWQSIGQASDANGLLLRDSDRIRFRPGSHYQGFAFVELRAWDRTSGTEGNRVDLTPPGSIGSSSAFSLAKETATVAVIAVNDAPEGANKTTMVQEDKAVVITLADFGFSDATDLIPNGFAQVVINTLPAKGALKLAGVPVVAGQAIPAAKIAANNLVYTPAANGQGSNYASLVFQVRDNGGTANGGIDLDPTPNTLTISVQSVNDAPEGANKTITILEDGKYLFSTGDFAFTDSKDTPANALKSIIIRSLPSKGSLTWKGQPAAINNEVPANSLSQGELVFTPAPNAQGKNLSSFLFQVRDNGGTDLGGVDLDPTPNQIVFNATAVNDAPDGTDKTISLLEDKSRTLLAADFGFRDPSDSPANTLASVVISSLPEKGQLRLGGKSVTLNQEVLLADITAARLVFTPGANENGASYSGFSFRVRDNGGVANGGVSLDPTPNTLTFSVVPVNDAPLGSFTTLNLAKNQTLVFAANHFPFSDPNDQPAHAFAGVMIASLPAKGQLLYQNLPIKAGTFVPLADLIAGKLRFVPRANETGSPYTGFTFRVADNGGIANGGVNFDPVARTLFIAVT